MYGAEITPNQHALAKQFGVLDNFSTAAMFPAMDTCGPPPLPFQTTSQRPFPSLIAAVNILMIRKANSWKEISGGRRIARRGGANRRLSLEEFRDARSQLSPLWRIHRVAVVANAKSEDGMSSSGPPKIAGVQCTRTVIKKGAPLDKNVGDPRGGPSPYPWEIPGAGKKTSRRNRNCADISIRCFRIFEVSYPDQLRVDEFLNEFSKFAESRKAGKDEMPQFISAAAARHHTAGLPGENRHTVGFRCGQ